MITKKTLRSGRVLLELDRDQVVPDDPGSGTPAMVWVGNDSGTYWCVTDTGETINGGPLKPSELAWLESMRDEVERFLYEEVP